MHSQRRVLVGVLVLGAATLLRAFDWTELEKRVTEFTLANGMHFIVLERHEAPVVSFHAYVDAGSVNDPSGKTGLAHMFEHMIGKGTTDLGSLNWVEEQRALEEVERAYDALELEKRKGRRADPQKLEALRKALEQAIERANRYVDPNKYVQVIEQNGAVGFNATTGADATQYFYSLPSNRVELWFLLQSEWFRQPVFREFYKERDVVREERRMRVESDPRGKLYEVLLATAFLAHPYRTIVGWASDIENLRAADAAWFHRTYYVPSNITVAIVGDVDPKEIRKLAERYFGRLEPGPPPPTVITEEPPQEGERRVAIESESQPVLMIAYKRPDQRHPDDPVLDVLDGVLSMGRTGLLYQELVRDRRIALAAGSSATFPSGKFPNTFLIYAVPNLGHSTAENEQAIYQILARLEREPVPEETLSRVKRNIRASIIRSLASNAGLAMRLAWYHVNYGDWRMMFRGLELIDRVSAEDIQRVVKQYFRPSQRTVAFLVQAKEAAQ